MYTTQYYDAVELLGQSITLDMNLPPQAIAMLLFEMTANRASAVGSSGMN